MTINELLNSIETRTRELEQSLQADVALYGADSMRNDARFRLIRHYVIILQIERQIRENNGS